MPVVNLSDPFIRGLKPAPKGERTDYSDKLIPGLRLRVSDKGRKAWLVWKRWGGKKNPSGRNIGVYGPENVGKQLTLAGARSKAREYVQMHAAGRDPKQEERAAAAVRRELQENTFSVVMEKYLKTHVKDHRKADQTGREMRKELATVLKDRPITEIKRHELVAIIDTILERGSNYQAHNIWGHARSLFNWALDSGYGLEFNPCGNRKPPALLSKANAKKSRQRVLSDDEIKAFWTATSDTPYPYGPLLRLLLLTGQRRNDIAAAQWGEIDAGKKLLTVPEERYKSEAVHLVPLTSSAMTLVKTLPRWSGEGTGDHLFSTTNGVKTVNGFSKAKSLLDAKMKDIMEKPVPDWVIHDLRRTVRTRLAQLNVPEHISELVIGHARAGLPGVYDRHSYLQERRAALEKWERLLLSIVKPAKGTNVVPMRGTA